MTDERKTIEGRTSQSEIEKTMREVIRKQLNSFFTEVVQELDFPKLRSVSDEFGKLDDRYRTIDMPSSGYAGTLPDEVYTSSPTFAEFLRNAMKFTNAGSKYDLARETDVSAPAINNYLTGKRSDVRDPRSAEAIKKLCNALGADYRRVVELYKTPRGEEK